MSISKGLRKACWLSCARAINFRAFWLLLLGSIAVADDSVPVEIEGIKGKLQRNLKLHLGDIERSLLTQRAELHTLVDDALDDALQPFGYYRANAELQIVDATLKISVQTGPQVKFAEPDLRLEGEAAALPELGRLLEKPPIEVGDELRHKVYDALKADLLQQVKDHGYMDAHYTRSRLEIDVQQAVASTQLWLQSGPRYGLGSLSFSPTRIDEDVLRRLTDIESGQPYMRRDVTQLTRQLQDTGYFQNVDVKRNVKPNGVVDLSVELADASRHRYDLGLGFSTDSSLRARVGWIQPAVNRRGHAARVEMFASSPRSQLNFTYRIPGEHPLHDSLDLGLGLEHRDIEGNPIDSGTLAAHFSSLNNSDWQYTRGANLSYEDYHVSDADDGEVFYLSPDLSLSRLRLDSGIDPRRGSRISLGAEGSHKVLGADAHYLRLYGRGSWLMPIGSGRLNVLLRAEAGAIVTKDIDKVPLTRRFFSGGDQSIRGYEFESVAPEDESGNLSGGKYLNVGSIEVSRRIKPSWRVAVFGDIGRSYTDSDERWRRSIGIGVRWLTPFGQLRVDLAAPISDSEANDVRIHFSLGPAL